MNTKKTAALVGRFILTLLIGVAILILLETIFRFDSRYGRVGFRFDNNLAWRLNKNLVALKPYAQWYVEGKKPFVLKFNNKGFRGDDFRKKKRKNVTRIMVMGDSYTAGLDYPDGEVFVDQIDHLLNQGKKEYELMNVSCPAWGTDQHYIYWKKEGVNYAPDYLLLVLSPNDLREMYNKKICSLDEGGNIKIEKAKIPRGEKIGWYLASRSGFYQFLQKKVFKSDYGSFSKVFNFFPVNYGKKDSKDWDAPLFLKEPFDEVDATFTLFEALFKDLKKSCDAIGTNLLLSKIPTESEFDGSYETGEHDPNKITNFIDSIAQRYNVPFCNLNEILSKEEDPLKVYMHWEYHFNKYGHDYLAKQLYPFIKENEK